MKIIKQKSITFLNWISRKSNKDIFFEYFPRPNLRNFIHYEFWYLYYSLFFVHIHFFLDSLEFQVNQENIHPTLTMLKVVIALSPIFICGFDIETLNHFLLHCPRFTNQRQKPLLKIESIFPNIFRKADTSITSVLLYCYPSFSAELKTNMFNSSIDYILYAKRFESAIFTDS